MNAIFAHYLDVSRLTRDAAASRLLLQTATGRTPHGLVSHPQFFSGTLAHPEVASAGLRALVEIASTRYFKPIPGGFASLDPIVTAHGDRLRCEVFSACNGVYARLDLLGDSFDSGVIGFGTTNIDINPPLALALAGIGTRDRLHLRVGPDEITLTADAGTYTERRVELPQRWIRGLAETQALASTLGQRLSLDGNTWRRFANTLPMSGGSGAGTGMWLLPGSAGLRQSSRPANGAVALPGSARLAAVRRVQHFVHAVRVFGPDIHADTQAAISAWSFAMPGARLVLMLSPEPWRGFSGEGAILPELGRADGDDAETLNALLAWEAAIDPALLAQEMAIPVRRVQHALQLLATAGQVGFDFDEQCHFHRQLPFSDSRLAKDYPRLAAARNLHETGAVSFEQERFRVRSEDREYWVHLDGDAARCTCPFWSKYRGSRGSCKHVLAAGLFAAAQQAVRPPDS